MQRPLWVNTGQSSSNQVRGHLRPEAAVQEAIAQNRTGNALILAQQRMLGRQFVSHPFGEPMLHIRYCHLIRRQRNNFLIVDQKTVSIFDFEIMRIAWLEFDNAALDRIIHDHSQTKPHALGRELMESSRRISGNVGATGISMTTAPRPRTHSGVEEIGRAHV